MAKKRKSRLKFGADHTIVECLDEPARLVLPAAAVTVCVNAMPANRRCVTANTRASVTGKSGAINGGTVDIENGIVDITKSGSEPVTFEVGGSGALELGAASSYKGSVTGFVGGIGPFTNQTPFIDLTNITFNSSVSRSYSGTSTSGVLTVTSGGHAVANINMIGTYTSADIFALRTCILRSPRHNVEGAGLVRHSCRQPPQRSPLVRFCASAFTSS
jgi:hypothetical protein